MEQKQIVPQATLQLWDEKMQLNRLQTTVNRIFGRVEDQRSFSCKENLMPLNGTSARTQGCHFQAVHKGTLLCFKK